MAHPRRASIALTDASTFSVPETPVRTSSSSPTKRRQWLELDHRLLGPADAVTHNNLAYLMEEVAELKRVQLAELPRKNPKKPGSTGPVKGVDRGDATPTEGGGPSLSERKGQLGKAEKAEVARLLKDHDQPLKKVLDLFRDAGYQLLARRGPNSINSTKQYFELLSEEEAVADKVKDLSLAQQEELFVKLCSDYAKTIEKRKDDDRPMDNGDSEGDGESPLQERPTKRRRRADSESDDAAHAVDHDQDSA